MAEKRFHNSSKAEKDEESFSYANQIRTSLVLPMSMHAALQLGLLEIIAKAGPDAKLTSKEIAAELTTRNPSAPAMLDRLLRLLATHCIVDCTVAVDGQGNPQRLYSLNPVSMHFVPNEDGVSLAPMMFLIQDQIVLDSWAHLKDAILEGETPFNRARGMHFFEYPAKDPRFNQVFDSAMMNESLLFVKKMLDSYKGFEQLNRVVDVGGGVGVTLSLITSSYPSIKGINFDLPHVIQNSPIYPGIEHVEGDMFESVPEGDAIFMKWILHDWTDEYCLKLLKNCYNAIPDDGKVIVVEAVLPPELDPTALMRSNLQMDMLMMTYTAGGKERTKSEFEALAIKAGFSGVRYECFVCYQWVMEFYK